MYFSELKDGIIIETSGRFVIENLGLSRPDSHFHPKYQNNAASTTSAPMTGYIIIIGWEWLYAGITLLY